jgi:hypothetical protein
MALAIAAGDSHSLVLLASGTLLAWGDNSLQQTSIPQGLTGVQAITTGRHHNLATRGDGTVVAWGFNAFGQTSVPQDLNNVTALAAGYTHSVALRSDGKVIAWGGNVYGQTNVPPDLEKVVAITAGDFHTLALRADGSIVGWGANLFGEINIPRGLLAAAIAAGYYHDTALVTAAFLRISRQAQGLLIEWTGPGTLQSAPALGGSYQDILTPAPSYKLNDLSGPGRFFRIRP